MIYKVLTITSSDTSGGAGLQSDLKTFQELGVYGMTVITSIVAQNFENNWELDTFLVEPSIIKSQLKTTLSGIGADCVKIGNIPTPETVLLIREELDKYSPKNIIVDSSLISKNGRGNFDPELVKCIKQQLIPIAKIITPNINEAAALTGLKEITSIEHMEAAAKMLINLGAKTVLIKGGSKLDYRNAIDLFYDGKDFDLLETPLITTDYTHGAGCACSAAITAGLAKGLSVKAAVRNAKDYVTRAIANGFELNWYMGVVQHSPNSKVCDTPVC